MGKSPKRGPASKRPKKAMPTSKPSAQAASKIDQVIAALRAPKGATIADLMKLTGWQMHSVRGAIAGAVKKARGLNVKSEKVDDERVYRIGGKP